MLRSPSKLVTLNPKLKSTGAGRYQLLSRGGMPTASSLAWKTLSESQDAVALQQLERGAYYDWSWWYPSGNRPFAQYPNFTAGRWLWSVQHKADSLIAKFKEAGERSEIDVWAESPRLSPRLVICIIVCLSWAVNHYRDNAITYKAQRDKSARELKLANAAIGMQMRQRDVAALDAKYTKELLMLKLKMMLCVMMLPLVVVGCTSKQSVSQCVKPPRTRRG